MTESLYQPLADGEIRVLKLHPGTGSDVLTGSLEHIKLGTFELAKPSVANSLFAYDAISYAWGEPLFDHSVNIVSFTKDEHVTTAQCYITVSLSDALYQFREEYNDLYVWADQICISQGDLSEKSVQVAMMAEIFRSARKVCVWLGVANEDDRLAFTALRFLADCSSNGQERLELDEIREQWTSYTPSISLNVGLNGFKNIAEKRWFKRLWVIQEVMVARRDAVFYCGSQYATHRELHIACETYMLLAKIEELRWLDVRQSIRVFETYDKHWRNLKHKGDASADHLIEILIETFDMQVSEPRDRIYALMSLADTRGSFPVKTDYAIALPDLWQDVAQCLFLRTKAFGPLLLALPATNSTRLELLSSWMTDFGALTPASHQKYRWYAIMWLGSSIAPKFAVHLDQGSLSLLSSNAALLGYVSSIVPGSSVPILEDTNPSPSDVNWLARQIVSYFITCAGFCQAQGDQSDLESLPLFLMQGMKERKYDRQRTMLWIALSHITKDKLHSLREFGNLDKIRSELSNLPVVQDRSYIDHTRLLARTSNKHLAMIPEQARVGDRVCLIYGCPAPFIVRERTDGYYMIVGDAYIPAITDGEPFTKYHDKFETMYFK